MTLPPMIDTPATARLGSMGSRITRKTFARRGVRVPITCTGAMSGEAKLVVSSKDARRLHLTRRTLATEDAQCYGAHSLKVTLKPSKSVAKRLARKGGPKRVRMTLTVRMRDFGRAPQTLRKAVTLKR
jgi:hypothetical protein